MIVVIFFILCAYCIVEVIECLQLRNGNSPSSYMCVFLATYE